MEKKLWSLTEQFQNKAKKLIEKTTRGAEVEEQLPIEAKILKIRMAELQKKIDLEYAKGSNILPLKFKAENSLVVEDVGEWRDTELVITKILDSFKVLKTRNSRALERYHDDVARRKKGEVFTTVPTPPTRSAIRKERKLLNEATKRFKILREQTIEIKDRYRSDTKPLIPGAEVEKHLPHEFFQDKDVPKIVKEIKSTLGEMGYDSITYYNEYEGAVGSVDNWATIVFDSKNIRSRFAKFDPKHKESADILKAMGGAIRQGKLIPFIMGGRVKSRHTMINKFNNFISASNKQKALSEFKNVI